MRVTSEGQSSLPGAGGEQIDDDARAAVKRIERAQDSVRSVLRTEMPTLQQFIDEKAHLIRRHADPQNRLGTGATSTSFSLWYLLDSHLYENVHTDPQWTPVPIGALSNAAVALGKQLVDAYVKHADGYDQTADLPNQYNSAIHAAGYLRAVRTLGVKPSRSVLKALNGIFAFLIDLLDDTDGWVYGLGLPQFVDREQPNPYLTFWVGCAIQELHDSGIRLAATRHVDLEEALASIARWGRRSCADLIAFHYAGLDSRFDVIELIYSSLCAVSFGESTTATALVRHAMKVALSVYLAGDGSLAPSYPVLADRRNYSLVVETPEALGTLLLIAPYVFDGLDTSLMRTFAWIDRRRAGSRGWGASALQTSKQATSFFVTTCLSFCAALSLYLDDAMNRIAQDALNAETLRPNARLSSFSYPKEHSKTIRNALMAPIQANRRELAAMSLLLHGPPGTSKTTIAEKIAHDLDWPLVSISPGLFLRSGFPDVEAEAERIFDLVDHLRDCVVLFDEIEELFTDREGPTEKADRFLTTALLPRLRDLHDARRVVVVFATNHVEFMDSAARRRGRIDLALEVLKPDEETREAMISAIRAKFGARGIELDLPIEGIFEAFIEADFCGRTDGFTYGDLEECIQRAIRQAQFDNEIVNVDSARSIIQAVKDELTDLAPTARKASKRASSR